MREGGNEGDRSYSSASYRLRARNAATFSHALAISSKRPLKLRAQSKGQNVSLSFSHSPTEGRLEPISKSLEEEASWTKLRKFWLWYSQRTRMRRCHWIQAKKRSTS